MKYNLEDLKREIPYKWKVQSFVGKKDVAKKATCVAYIDARDVMNLLDKVVGPTNWKDKPVLVNGNLYYEISIYDPEKKEWISKMDCGTESMAEKEKGESSDAFKRTAVKWGVGRFLYGKEIMWVDVNKGKPVDNGKPIYDMTKYQRPKDKSWKRASAFIKVNEKIDSVKDKSLLVPLYKSHFGLDRMLNPSDSEYHTIDANVLKVLMKEVTDLLK